MFKTPAGVITTLGTALFENRLEVRLEALTQPKLLIIDEIDCIQIDRQGANLFSQLTSRRCERGWILVTSNRSLGAWGELFRDLRDRQRNSGSAASSGEDDQHQGDSYRLKA
jgi:DNA replication protein DnaC